MKMATWASDIAGVLEYPSGCRDLFKQLRAGHCSAVDSTTYLAISSTKVTRDHIRRIA